MMEGHQEQETKGDGQQSLSALFGQLAADTSDFAKAELVFLKAEAGERVDYAVPGLILAALAVALALGALLVLFVGLVLWLAPLIGAPLAACSIAGLGGALAILAWRAGIRRLTNAIKTKDDR
jgi:pilus assembly protein TadC